MARQYRTSKHGERNRYALGCRCRVCREAQRKYHARYSRTPEGFASRKRSWTRVKLKKKRFLNARKLASGCVDCGYKKHPSALCFDHVRGKKRFVLARAWDVSWKRMLEEIQKCEVRCANCHIIRHSK